MQKLNGGYSYVTCSKIAFDEIDKVDFAACREPKETLLSFYNRQYNKPKVLVNGGFFGMKDGLPCFNMMDEGVVRAYENCYKWGIGITREGKVKCGNIDEGVFKDFISGYPCLVNNGTALPINYAKEVDGRQPRSLIGYNDTHLFIVTVDGRQKGKPGMNFAECAALMIKFGCKFAVALDGGGSSRMLIDGKVANSPTENRDVDNVVAVYCRSANSPAPTPSVPAPITGTYVVKSGDSFWKIADTQMGNGLRYKELAAYNGLNINSALKVGQTLKIPNPVSTPSTPTYETYSVKKGDSLSKIAAAYLGNASRYNEIMEYNGLTSTTIYVGQIIKIPK